MRLASFSFSLRFLFLAQGHLRKKWKVRKIVLKDNPAVLEYYAASKASSSCIDDFVVALTNDAM